MMQVVKDDADTLIVAVVCGRKYNASTVIVAVVVKYT